MKTLFLTVGGSPEPLLKAIAEERPDRVTFFCTGRDPATQKPGSDTEVPGLAVRAGLAAGSYSQAQVPADDLEGCLAVMMPALAAAVQAGGAAIADYTGGTKTMVAALVLAAQETAGVELRLTGGARADLNKVAGGSEHGIPVSLARPRFRRALAAALVPWRRYAYAESGLLLSEIAAAAPEQQAWLTRATDLSRAFAAWDRFDHATAQTILEQYRPAVGRIWQEHLTVVHALTAAGPRQAPARLWDLWRNAERRAAQARYDDALARWYRFTEGLAQWMLQRHFGIATGEIPPGKVPAGLELPRGRQGQLYAGLFEAWRLLAALAPESPAAAFFSTHQDDLRRLLKSRNESLLAHGMTPVSGAAWQEAADFAERHLLPLLAEEARAAAREGRPLLDPWPQLPQAFPEDMRTGAGAGPPPVAASGQG